MPTTNPTPQQLLESQLLENSPLKEIDRDSLSELFRRINDGLAIGMPEEIPDSDLDEMVDILQAKRLSFLTEQDKKAQSAPKRRSKKVQGTLELLDNL